MRWGSHGHPGQGKAEIFEISGLKITSERRQAASRVHSYCCFCLCAGSVWCVSKDAGHGFKAGQLPSLSAAPAGKAGTHQLAGSRQGCNEQNLLGALSGIGRTQTPAYCSELSKEEDALSFLLTPGTSKFGFLATNRAIQARKG